MIVIKNIEQTCEACPSQWSGQTEDNQEVYIRYRWGYLYVEINQEQVYGAFHGDGLHGYMTTTEMMENTYPILDWSICIEYRHEYN